MDSTIIKQPVIRESYIDICKGLCMILVLFMHVRSNLPYCDPLSEIGKFIATCYMPCFFIMSGFFIKLESFSNFFIKKCKSLLLPLFFVYILSFLIALVVNKINPTILKNEVSFGNLFYSNSFTNGPIWFLSALFFSILIVYFIKHLPNITSQCMLVIPISLIGYYWNYFFAFRLPMFWDSGLTATLFVWLGSYLKNIISNFENRYVCFALCVFFLLLSFCFRDGSEMQYNSYPLNCISYYFPAIMGSLGLLFASKTINKSKVIEYIGCNSLIILCFHMFIVMLICLILKRFDIDLLIQNVVSLLFSLALCMLMIPLVKKAFFFIFK